MVARRRDGGWSAPSALGSAGLGWGFQVGGEVREIVLIFRAVSTVSIHCFERVADRKSSRKFCSAFFTDEYSTVFVRMNICNELFRIFDNSCFL